MSVTSSKYKYEDEFFSYELRPEGYILGITKLTVINIDMCLATKMMNERKRVAGGKTYPMLTEVYAYPKASKEVRHFFASKENLEGMSACAILVKNQMAKFAANIWMIVDKPLVKTKIFTDKEEALVWMKKITSQNENTYEI